MPKELDQLSSLMCGFKVYKKKERKNVTNMLITIHGGAGSGKLDLAHRIHALLADLEGFNKEEFVVVEDVEFPNEASRRVHVAHGDKGAMLFNPEIHPRGLERNVDEAEARFQYLRKDMPRTGLLKDYPKGAYVVTDSFFGRIC